MHYTRSASCLVKIPIKMIRTMIKMMIVKEKEKIKRDCSILGRIIRFLRIAPRIRIVMNVSLMDAHGYHGKVNALEQVQV